LGVVTGWVRDKNILGCVWDVKMIGTYSKAGDVIFFGVFISQTQTKTKTKTITKTKTKTKG
jgi:hypothetical protein